MGSWKKLRWFYVVVECHRSGSAFKHSEALYSFLPSSSPNLYSSSVPQKYLVKRFCSGDYMSCCRKSRAHLLCDETMLLFADMWYKQHKNRSEACKIISERRHKQVFLWMQIARAKPRLQSSRLAWTTKSGLSILYPLQPWWTGNRRESGHNVLVESNIVRVLWYL